MFHGAWSFKQPATLKHFGLVLLSPSRAHAVKHARRPTISAVSNAHDSTAARTSAAHARTHCSTAFRTCTQPDGHALPQAHADQRTAARALQCCIMRGQCATHGRADTHAWTPRTPAHMRARSSGRSARAPPSCRARTPAVAGHSQYSRSTLAPFHRWVPRALRRPTSACVAGAGVESPGAGVGADVGSLRACAPQKGAAPCTVAHHDRIGRPDYRHGR
jgi:hypothetical protein